MKPIILKCQGRKFDPNPPKPALEKLLAFLKQAPPDEIFLPQDLAVKLQLSSKHIRTNSQLPEMQSYTALVANRRYVGSKAAIAELKRQTGQ